VDYPRQANEVLELLGHLAGLYMQLQATILKQTQTYEDLLHQLRNPVFMAQKRSAKLKSVSQQLDSQSQELDAVCGLLGKASRVVINLQLFADLAAGKDIDPDFQSLSPADLIRPLIELASDNRILWRRRKIGFFVETATFQFNAPLQVDMDLFEQAAGNILDNCGKYGTPDETTTIAATLVAGRDVRIAFRGKSIPISREDARSVGKRGWRGREARMRSAEGHGIGLWMAARIMKAHHGRLEVLPTDADGYNEIRLVFPVLRP
jgi:signal transduction histidine kinase